MSDQEKLVEAYHLVFDVKDDNYSNDKVRIACYEITERLEDIIEELGGISPKRYDRP
jgi:hypothetical protein